MNCCYLFLSLSLSLALKFATSLHNNENHQQTIPPQVYALTPPLLLFLVGILDSKYYCKRCQQPPHNHHHRYVHQYGRHHPLGRYHSQCGGLDNVTEGTEAMLNSTRMTFEGTLTIDLPATVDIWNNITTNTPLIVLILNGTSSLTPSSRPTT